MTGKTLTTQRTSELYPVVDDQMYILRCGRNEPEKLVHYSNMDSVEVWSNTQNPREFKPAGLWVTVEGEDDWKSWCQRENFQLENLMYAYDVKLNAASKILRLQSAADIDMFTTQYQSRWQLSPLHAIDWRKVASEYSAIIIAPYIYQRRHTPQTLWYYPWDCASGCIWDKDAIESIKLREVSHEILRSDMAT